MYVVYADFAPQVWYSNEFRFIVSNKEPPSFNGSSESVWLVPGTAE